MIRFPLTDRAHASRPPKNRPWLGLRCILLTGAVLSPVGAQNVAQNFPAPTAPQRADPQQLGGIERRIADLADTLAQTQAALRRSQAELLGLRAEVNALRGEKLGVPSAGNPGTGATPAPPATDASLPEDIGSLKEQQQILQAEVKQHEQTKVESASKYGLTVTGIALFNAYSNAGVVDNTEIPSFAYPRNPGYSHGSLGGTLRQTVLGLDATGPVIAGAQTFASVNVDFFGGAATSSFGYTAAQGYVRMRDGEVGLTWNRSQLQVGYFGPLISPLSPTSFATVAQPALSESGNLWIWSPQISFQQSLPIHRGRGLSLEGGLISPPSPAYSSAQLDSPTQASRRPGAEGRVAYHSDSSFTASPRSLAFGVGAYTAGQLYNSSARVHAWAVTGDWLLPLSRSITLSGEAYRGRALGGLGGGLYKDILSGTDRVSGLTRTVGVEAAGGWAQLKLSPGPRWEANAMFGVDDAFANGFHSLVLPTGSSSPTLTARNRTATGNLIFRPFASIILSPEYRRVVTWRYTGGPYIANIFTVSAGYKF